MPGNLMERMGAKLVAPLKRGRKNPDGPIFRAQTSDEDALEGNFNHVEGEDEKIRLQMLRIMIEKEPNIFLLNNLVLSMQLFTHYEKEIADAREAVTLRERELNRRLQPTKVVLLPDILHEHFNGRIRFNAFSKDEPTVEPLRPIKLYVSHENVLVTELDDAKHYSSPAELKVNHTFILKEAKLASDLKEAKLAGDQKEAKLAGYARLEQANPLLSRGGHGSENDDLSSIVESHDEIYSEDDGSVYGVTAVNGIRQQQNGGSASMPDLLDEELYEESGFSNGSSALSRVHNVRIQSKIARLHKTRQQQQQQQQQQQVQLRFNHASNPSSASSSSSGYTTTTYNVDSDSDSSGSRGALRRPNSPRDTEIPSKCFKRVTYTREGKIYKPPTKQLTSRERQMWDLKIVSNYDVVYVNSYKFAKHFERLFRDNLAKMLEFDDRSIKDARRTVAAIRLEKIFYNIVKNYMSIEQYEILPCFSSPWPRWARGWLKRPKRTSWPSAADLHKVDKSVCYLVPESLRPGTELHAEDSLWRLDWCLNVPAAERYLETCLSQAQMTVYTIALMMHKTFIKKGLEPGHIRNMLFWMVEKTPEWSEFEIGTFMLALIKVLHTRTTEAEMRDFFLEKRNLFSNVVRKDLLHSQKQLKRVLENPVMFVFHALEKIEYENEDYPRLNYQELLKLLTRNELCLLNRNLDPSAKKDDDVDEDYNGRGRFWNDVKEKDKYYAKTRGSNTRNLINPRQMDDSIIDIQVKCEPLTQHRLAKLLIFFSEHFVQMAFSCHKLGAGRMKRIYLEQARLLAIYLANDVPDYEDSAKNLLEGTRRLQRDINLTAPPPPLANGAPETPRRNEDAPLFVRSLKDGYAMHTMFPTVPEDSESMYGESTSRSEVNVEVHAAGSSQVQRNRSYHEAVGLSESLAQRLRIDEGERNGNDTRM